jgi:DNA-binding response OmpR family regulator
LKANGKNACRKRKKKEGASPRALRASGYRVVNAAATLLAYQIAITRPTDIVVTDGHCAGSMNGLELTRRMRIHHTHDNRPHPCDNKRDEAGW